MDLSPKSASLALAERLKERNSSALIELARSRNSYLSKASCKQRKQEIRGCTVASVQQLASFLQLILLKVNNAVTFEHE